MTSVQDESDSWIDTYHEHLKPFLYFPSEAEGVPADVRHPGWIEWPDACQYLGVSSPGAVAQRLGPEPESMSLSVPSGWPWARCAEYEVSQVMAGRGELPAAVEAQCTGRDALVVLVGRLRREALWAVQEAQGWGALY